MAAAACTRARVAAVENKCARRGADEHVLLTALHGMVAVARRALDLSFNGATAMPVTVASAGELTRMTAPWSLATARMLTRRICRYWTIAAHCNEVRLQPALGMWHLFDLCALCEPYFVVFVVFVAVSRADVSAWHRFVTLGLAVLDHAPRVGIVLAPHGTWCCDQVPTRTLLLSTLGAPQLCCVAASYVLFHMPAVWACDSDFLVAGSTLLAASFLAGVIAGSGRLAAALRPAAGFHAQSVTCVERMARSLAQVATFFQRCPAELATERRFALAEACKR